MINEVDSLKTQIVKIQSNCNHDWRLLEKPGLSVSLVPGVFIGKREPCGIAPKLISICTKCSKKLVTSIRTTCPNCLSPMREIGLYTLEHDGASSCKKYFGRDCLHYAVTLDHCTKCDFCVVSNEREK